MRPKTALHGTDGGAPQILSQIINGIANEKR